MLQSAVDLGQQVDLRDGKAWVGLNGWNGAASERNEITSWSFASAQPVPEPSTAILLIGAGTVLLSSKIRRR